MKYKNFGNHMTKYTIMAIDRITYDTDPEVILELMERVSNFVKSGIITDEQYQQIQQALDEKVDYDIPEDHTTEGLSLENVAYQVEVQGDAISELGELMSGLLPDEEPEDGEPEDGNSDEYVDAETDQNGEV